MRCVCGGERVNSLSLCFYVWGWFLGVSVCGEETHWAGLIGDMTGEGTPTQHHRHYHYYYHYCHRHFHYHYYYYYDRWGNTHTASSAFSLFRVQHCHHHCPDRRQAYHDWHDTIVFKLIIKSIIPSEIMWVVSTRVVEASALQAPPSVQTNIIFSKKHRHRRNVTSHHSLSHLSLLYFNFFNFHH